MNMLDPNIKKLLRAEVRATFKVPNAGTVAVLCTGWKITRNSMVRLLNDIVIFEGKIYVGTKDDVREVVAGYEGGLGLSTILRRYNKFYVLK